MSDILKTVGDAGKLLQRVKRHYAIKGRDKIVGDTAGHIVDLLYAIYDYESKAIDGKTFSEIIARDRRHFYEQGVVGGGSSKASPIKDELRTQFAARFKAYNNNIPYAFSKNDHLALYGTIIPYLADRCGVEKYKEQLELWGRVVDNWLGSTGVRFKEMRYMQDYLNRLEAGPITQQSSAEADEGRARLELEESLL